MPQFSVTVRNAIADAVETTIGVSPTLEIRTGAAPADCAAADSGTVLATMTLPADWLGAAAAAVKALAGTWQDATADATGTPGHYRIKQGATCHWQGAAGAAAEMTIGDIAAGSAVTITSGNLTAGNG